MAYLVPSRPPSRQSRKEPAECGEHQMQGPVFNTPTSYAIKIITSYTQTPRHPVYTQYMHPARINESSHPIMAQPRHHTSA